MEEEEDEIKLIFLHDSAVGSTSIIKIAARYQFNEIDPSTINPSFIAYRIKYNNKSYNLNILDANGYKSNICTTKIFINNSKIVIYVFDITNRESFETLNFCIEFAKKQFR